MKFIFCYLGAKVVFYDDTKHGPTLELTWANRTNASKRYHVKFFVSFFFLLLFLFDLFSCMSRQLLKLNNGCRAFKLLSMVQIIVSLI